MGIVLVRVVSEPIPCTSTTIVHVPATSATCAGMVPPLMEMVCEPATASTVPPTQVVLALGVGATMIPFVAVPGNGSVTETFTNGEAFVFCNVIASVEMPPGLTAGGVNVLLIENGLTTRTVKFAVRLLGMVRF